ncbi:MAG TPA: ArsR family transcriptional regulator [Gemmatimonadales bacterium]|nr:ArsR family transcriptional regulator [Gemmatimonadales bacterium]
MADLIPKLAGETQAKLLKLLRRGPHTIGTLAEALGLTDNAVRTHIAALGRDGLVEQRGSVRDTGGKPARLYALTSLGEDLFPKAYAAALQGLLEEIAAKDGWDRAVALLRAVGTRAAATIPAPADLAGRVTAAAGALRDLGADLDVRKTAAGWELKGYACPLSALTAEHHQVCALVTALVAEVTGRPVDECCEYDGGPRCRFRVAAG